MRKNAEIKKAGYDVESFREAVQPLIMWLNENSNYHATVIVDMSRATLLTDKIIIRTDDFFKDRE
ncbi:hypothetical protein [Enterobacter asburiae]|uniref:hypothetical protein n=1 Tax=Enterobacter asburiae TaxID=61645 RepID=UPI0032D92979